MNFATKAALSDQKSTSKLWVREFWLLPDESIRTLEPKELENRKSFHKCQSIKSQIHDYKNMYYQFLKTHYSKVA